LVVVSFPQALHDGMGLQDNRNTLQTRIASLSPAQRVALANAMLPQFSSAESAVQAAAKPCIPA